MTDWTTFRIRLRTRPPDAGAGPQTTIAGIRVPTVKIEHIGEPFTVSFETAQQRLDQLERLFIEPDGAFVWRGEQNGVPWQVDGHLYDRHDRLIFVELTGTCPAAAWTALLEAFGVVDEANLLVEMIKESVHLAFDTFRQISFGQTR